MTITTTQRCTFKIGKILKAAPYPEGTIIVVIDPESMISYTDQDKIVDVARILAKIKKP